MRQQTIDRLKELKAFESDDALVSISDDELEKICRELSFDRKRFRKRLEIKDRLTQVITTHLFLEHIANDFLEQQFKIKGLIRLERWGLLQKIQLLRALGVLSETIFNCIVRINSLRNRAAHKHDFTISEAEVETVLSLFPHDLFAKVEHKRTFKNALFFTVAFFERERMEAELSSIKRLQANAKLIQALKPFESPTDRDKKNENGDSK